MEISQTMKHQWIPVLVLTFSGASLHAEQYPVRMTFTGSAAYLGRQIILGPNTSQVADLSQSGDGSLGPFTLREMSATGAMPSGTGCAGPNSAAFTFVAGAGVYRFRDGSLLTYKIKDGHSCIDFTAAAANTTVTQQITGGTGRFKNASGTLTLTTLGSYPILFDASGQQPVLVVFPNGTVTGTIVAPESN
jgi:hypothetical protein